MKQLLLVLLLLPVFTEAQIITTIAGGATGHGGYYWGEGGAATACEFYGPVGLAITSFGDLYISDALSNRILKVNQSTGVITTIAGTGIAGFSGDGGPATAAQLNRASYITLDTMDNLYITDAYNYRVRKVDITTGIISTFAGNGILGTDGDGGPATAAKIASGAMAWDHFGNMYIGDIDELRKIDPLGNISTVAGTGMSGVTIDGTAATATNLGTPAGICTDKVGNVYICDSTLTLRKLTVSTGIISRVAGTGDNTGSPYSGDGLAATACHLVPFTVAIDDLGNLYISGYGNNRIYNVDPLGIIHSIAGTGASGFSGDGGSATAAKLYAPRQITLDACGNIFIADFANKRVRKVTQTPILTVPSISISGVITAPAGTTVTVTATVAKVGSSYIIHWMNHGIEFTTTTVPSVTYTKGIGIDTITARVVSTATYGCYDSTTSVGHIVSETPVGVLELNPKANIDVYPNPVNEVLNITAIIKVKSVQISNMLGQSVFTHTYNAEQVQIDVAELPASVYLVKINGNEVRKFVKH